MKQIHICMILCLLIGCSEQNMDEKEETATSTQKKQITSKKQYNQPKNPKRTQPQHQHNKNKGGQLPPIHKKMGIHVDPVFSLEGDVAKQLSIVLISLDTVRADSLSIYGGRAEVPNLEKLASRSVVFSQAISHFPETALSHWSMMSGVLPEVHGNVPSNGGSIYKGPTLAEIAKKQGYATAAIIGGITMTDQASGFKRGFDLYDDQFPIDPKDMMREGTKVTKNAVNWIQKHRTKNPSQPFFLFAHYFDAHFPYTPKPPYDTKYDATYKGNIDGTDAVLRPYRDGEKIPSQRDIDYVRALYDGEISELDSKIGPLLEEVGDDCIVIVTSDHGESFEHGYYFNHRAGLWDGIVHVPLIIQVPEFKQKIEYKEQVGLIDLTPTVLSLAGLPIDKNFQGRDLQSEIQLRNDNPQNININKTSHSVFSITDPWMPQPQFAVRTLDWKYIQQENRTLVYQLSSDPDEKNLISSASDDFLQAAQKRYQESIDKKSFLLQQTSSKNGLNRHISDEECKRLEALGYTTCDKK
jgi:arylsulfatase A-like enzyme